MNLSPCVGKGRHGPQESKCCLVELWTLVARLSGFTSHLVQLPWAHLLSSKCPISGDVGTKDPNACECSGRKVRKSHLNAKPTIPKALVNIPSNDARVARRCMMLLHLLERDSQRVLESKKIKDPSLEIKWHFG